MSTTIDPYATLGLSHRATSSEIRKAYQKLALQYHPDRRSSNNDGEDIDYEEKMVQINEAYGILKDEEQKRQYDRLYRFGGGGFRATSAPSATTSAASANRTHTTSARPTARATRAAARSQHMRERMDNHRKNGGGSSFSFTSTSTKIDPQTGGKATIRKTTRYQNNKKIVSTETQILYPDGRVEYKSETHEEENVSVLGSMFKSMFGGTKSEPNSNSKLEADKKSDTSNTGTDENATTRTVTDGTDGKQGSWFPSFF
jgi:curved DNA-binding protein CbpA